MESKEFTERLLLLFPQEEKENFRENLLKAESFRIDFYSFQNISNLTHKVIVIEESDKDNLMISNCQSCSIYFKSTVKLANIYKCKNCEIFIEGVKKITLLQNCSEIKLTLITKFLNASNILDSQINLCSSFGPNLLGEIRNVTIGPYNANFVDIWSTLEACKIKLNKETTTKFAFPLIFYNCQGFLNPGENSYKTQDPSEFTRFILPKSFSYYPCSELLKNKEFRKLYKKMILLVESCQNQNCNIPLLAPDNYLKNLLKKQIIYQNFKKKIKEKKLSAHQTEKFLYFVQGNFREWLLAKPRTNDVLKIINTIK